MSSFRVIVDCVLTKCWVWAQCATVVTWPQIKFFGLYNEKLIPVWVDDMLATEVYKENCMVGSLGPWAQASHCVPKMVG